MNLSITACSFCLKKYNSKTSDDVFSVNNSFKVKDSEGNIIIMKNCFNLFEDFFINYNKIFNDKENSRAFNCIYSGEKIETDDYVMYPVEVNSGIYGSSTDIYNVINGNKTYSKSKNEADLRKFYVIVVLPKDREDIIVKKGMLIFQNVGRYGIKTMLTDKIDEYLKNKYNIVLRCSTIAPSLFVKRVFNRKSILGFTFVKNQKSSDSVDNYEFGYGKETRIIKKISITESKWDSLKQRLNSFINHPYSGFSFEGVLYDNVKLFAEIGEKNRNISLAGIENISIIEAIPNEIKDNTGNADKDKLIEYLKQIIVEYLEEMILI